MDYWVSRLAGPEPIFLNPVLRSNKLVAGLVEILDSNRVLFEPEHLIPYGFDGTATYQAMPAAVVFPRSTDEVAGLGPLRGRGAAPLVTRGSGTG